VLSIKGKFLVVRAGRAAASELFRPPLMAFSGAILRGLGLRRGFPMQKARLIAAPPALASASV